MPGELNKDEGNLNPRQPSGDDSGKEPKTWNLKVDGKVESYDEDKITELAQKGLAADARFQEAAQVKKDAEAALVIQEDVGAMLKGDPEAFRRLGKAYDLPPGEVEDALQARRTSSTSSGKEQESNSGQEEGGVSQEQLNRTMEALKERQVGYGDLSKEVQTALLETVKARHENLIRDGVDKHKDLAYHMKRTDDAGRARLASLVRDEVRGRLSSSGRTLSAGAPELTDSLDSVAALAKSLEGTPVRPTPPLGLGPSPGGSEIERPKSKPEHVSSQDPEFEEHILLTMLHNEAVAGAGSS